MFTQTARQGVKFSAREPRQSRPLLKALVAVVLIAVAVGLGLSSLL